MTYRLIFPGRIFSLNFIFFYLFLYFPVGAQEIVSNCPSPNGYFADAEQCDKYYECVDGVITEKLCEDGLGFNDLNPRVEKCDYLFQIDCTDRPKLRKFLNNKKH